VKAFGFGFCQPALKISYLILYFVSTLTVDFGNDHFDQVFSSSMFGV
jgi:hypothetical protein